MRPRRLAVSLGDPAGIGPELTLRAFLDRGRLGLPPFFAVGPVGALEAHAAALGLPCPVRRCDAPEDIEDMAPDLLPVIDPGPEASVVPGALSEAGARAAISAIETAVRLVVQDRASGIVTQPIHKANMKTAGFAFPGHTEFLAALSVPDGQTPPRPVMMLASEDLRVVPVTIHIPLHDVPQALTTDLIVETGTIVAAALKQDFGIAAPRLALAGLNPHAGENGVLGHEDNAVVAPAITALKAAGIDATGPWPADTLFHAEARATYDAALAMYHDQALIPIKTIAFDKAVNVTLGLPFVRTSPDHGTALDIAGKGIARLDSFVAALRLASTMAARRRG